MKIGEIAQQTGVSRSMIRYYESTGVIPPPRRDASDYRDYSEIDLSRVRLVVNARHVGFSFCDIQEILAMCDRHEAPCTYLSDLIQRKAKEIEGLMYNVRWFGTELCHLHDLASTFPVEMVESKVCHYHQTNK